MPTLSSLLSILTNRKIIDSSDIEESSELKNFDRAMKDFIVECFDFYNAQAKDGENKYKLKDKIGSIWEEESFVPRTKSLGTSIQLTREGKKAIKSVGTTDFLTKKLGVKIAQLDKQIKTYKECDVPTLNELIKIREEANGYLNMMICMTIRAKEVLPEHFAKTNLADVANNIADKLNQTPFSSDANEHFGPRIQEKFENLSEMINKNTVLNVLKHNRHDTPEKFFSESDLRNDLKIFTEIYADALEMLAHLTFSDDLKRNAEIKGKLKEKLETMKDFHMLKTDINNQNLTKLSSFEKAMNRYDKYSTPLAILAGTAAVGCMVAAPFTAGATLPAAGVAGHVALGLAAPKIATTASRVIHNCTVGISPTAGQAGVLAATGLGGVGMAASSLSSVANTTVNTVKTFKQVGQDVKYLKDGKLSPAQLLDEDAAPADTKNLSSTANFWDELNFMRNPKSPTNEKEGSFRLGTHASFT